MTTSSTGIGQIIGSVCELGPRMSIVMRKVLSFLSTIRGGDAHRDRWLRRANQ